jgi:hypothetical protein
MFGGLWYVCRVVGGLVVGLGGLVVWWFSTMTFKVVRVFFFLFVSKVSVRRFGEIWEIWEILIWSD